MSLVPVRWQIVEKGHVGRSAVHRATERAVEWGGETECGETIPRGCWFGAAVSESALAKVKCPKCWAETTQPKETP